MLRVAEVQILRTLQSIFPFESAPFLSTTVREKLTYVTQNELRAVVSFDHTFGLLYNCNVVREERHQREPNRRFRPP